jgi:hypothetical protein
MRRASKPILIGEVEALEVLPIHRGELHEVAATFYLTTPEPVLTDYVSVIFRHDGRLRRGSRYRMVLEPIE